ncbi:helix-turn-helix transcriptional regulator [Lentzea sp. DG1S-22]|uniref:helix-turn-helix domain-containing protein n=1 Tax=Lentzea sp. DG1S-22 TaxID=3108822 RepID=UPI002E7882D6|nr:helix-turn-helix transcriptional regulator [Lentzea sp. DG1S-22]WVH84343.1 helix-turn-helix transcriptional regulator [Lentzea sp. DG1S-22]
MDDISSTMDAIGPRLRRLRKQRDLTLTGLARSTGISVSTLSRLESGQRRATIELLLPLARELRVAMDDLIGAPETGDPRLRSKPITRNGMTLLPLTQRAGNLQAYKLIIYPRRRPRRPEVSSHEGYEWLYVLNGRLRLVLGGNDLVMGPGEAAEFDTKTPHWFGNADEHPVEVLTLFGHQGERVHLRAAPSRAKKQAQGE